MIKKGEYNLSNFSLLLGGLIFALIFTEFLLRLLPGCNKRYNFNQYAVKNNPMNKAMSRVRDYKMYKPSSVLGYEIIPHSAPGVNSFGMIGREHQLKKEKGTYRILVLGDSITEHNWYVEELEKKLNNSDPKLDYKFELWNGGVMGYQINQYAAYLKQRGTKYDPDMVIIAFCLNDFYTSYWVFYKDYQGFSIFYNPARNLSKVVPLNKFLFKYSYLYRFLILVTDNFLSDIKKNYHSPKSEGLTYLEVIKGVCRKNNILLLAAILPYLKPLKEYRNKEIDRYKEMTEVLGALKVDYVDLHKSIAEEERYKLRLDKDDYIHPSFEGHKVIADKLYKYLIENYFNASNKNLSKLSEIIKEDAFLGSQ